MPARNTAASCAVVGGTREELRDREEDEIKQEEIRRDKE
jgi:hypothetical protein